MKQQPTSASIPNTFRQRQVYSWFSRPLVVILAIGLLTTSLLTSCTPAAPPAAEGTPGDSAQIETESAAGGGTLTVATNLEPDPTNPHNRTESNLAWYLAVYDTLTQYDDNLEPQPRLAESWAWNDDFTELTLHLRQGVQFHTGREMTAEDVKWNIEKVQEPDNTSQLKRSMQAITNIEIPDPYTIVLTFDETTLNFFDTLEAFNIADPESWEEIENGDRAVGTGPFVWQEWVPGDHLTLTRNPNYWMEDVPHLDGIEVRIVPDRGTMVLNLESEAVDIINGPPALDVKSLQDDDRFSVLLSENQAPRYVLGFNVLNPPVDNKLVRQALNYAIPRERFARTALLGLVEPTALPWTTNSPAYEADLAQSVTLDLDRAQALLEEAGVEPGALTIEYNPAFGDLEQFAVMYQEELSKLGFDVTLSPLEAAVFSEKFQNAEITHMYLSVHNNHMLFPTSLLTQNRPYRVADNASNFESEEYARLVSEASTTLDPEARQALFHQINELLLDEAFVIPFANQPYAWVMQSNVGGLDYTKFNWMRYQDVVKE